MHREDVAWLERTNDGERLRHPQGGDIAYRHEEDIYIADLSQGRSREGMAKITEVAQPQTFKFDHEDSIPAPDRALFRIVESAQSCDERTTHLVLSRTAEHMGFPGELFSVRMALMSVADKHRLRAAPTRDARGSGGTGIDNKCRRLSPECEAGVT